MKTVQFRCLRHCFSMLTSFGLFICAYVLVCNAERHLWFTAVGSGAETDYLMMIQAAVESGLQCCKEALYPVVVVGGDPALIPSWLVDLHNNHEIVMLNHNLSFTSRIDKFGKDKSLRAHGAFQRLDIPLLVGDISSQLFEEGVVVCSDFAMYTDADVLLYNTKDFVKPNMIAYGAEDEKGQAANSGVLFMNVANMKKEIEQLFDFADQNLWNFPAIEQGLVLQYFRGKHTQLSDTYNWKPYWGINPNASIVHFHGAKVDRCVECFIKNMYTADKFSIGKCSNQHHQCGAFALWNAVARHRYNLTIKKQMQAYVHYVRDVYKFVFDLSVRLDDLNNSGGAKLRRAYSINAQHPRQKDANAGEKNEEEQIKDIYFKNHPVEN